MLKTARRQSLHLNRVAKNDACASMHINIAGHYDNDTLLDQSGKLLKLFRLKGIDFVTKDDATLDIFKHRRNTLLKSFSSEFAFYFWMLRKKTTEFPEGEFRNPFAAQVNEKYKNKIQRAEMYQNTLYFALLTKPPEGYLNKGLHFVRSLSQKLDKSAQQKYLQQKHKELMEYVPKLLHALSAYQPEILGVYEKQGVKYSAALAFLSELLNFDKNTVPLEAKDVAAYLPRKRLFFNRRAGIIEMRAADDSKRFAAVLSIKEYPTTTWQGMFDRLMSLPIEYVITQSFRFYDRHESKTKLRDQQKELAQSKDESISQTQQISRAFDEAAAGEVGYGAHHFVLVCYANSKELLNKQAGEIVAKFNDIDIQCVREDLVSECGFWSQFPGNFAYIARSGDISTKNMAAFASLHNYSLGRIKGNHWGNAVTVFETLSGSPYYFNFHYKDVGNFLVFGTMGSGKTVLVGFLILQSMKFGGKRVLFDKDRGLEILVRAMGGIYETLRPGVPTGFNPCSLDDTVENRKFLAMLFKKMLETTGQPLQEADYAVIDHAIAGMYRLQPAERQLCHIASFFGAKNKNPLRNRFEQWHSDGAHAWLFDNTTDSLNLNTDVMGFDIGSILKDEDCKTPALMYLTWRIEKAMQGQRGMIFFDEGWKALSDPYFKNMINDESRTPRKKNHFLGLATQAAEDTVKSELSRTINSSSACKIFFPNPLADRQVYMSEFGLSEQEYHLIKTMPDDRNYFLLNYGHGKESVVIRANLHGMEDEIAVISGRQKTVELLDRIRAEVGDNPADWLPVFHERRKRKEEMQ